MKFMRQRPVHRLDLFGMLLVAGLFLAPPALAADEGIACEREPTDMRIRYGDVVECELDRIGDDDVFRFSGGSGETIRIQISRRDGGRACFQLFDPEGRSLDSLRCANAGLDYVLPRTGSYNLIVTELFLDEAATYQIALERIDPPSPTARPIDFSEIIDDGIDLIGDMDIFFFDGAADDTVRLQISRLNGGRACFQLYAPDGAAIDTLRCANTGLDYDLGQSGRHAVVVSELFLDETADYALTLICVSGRCPDLRLPAVAGCVTFRGAPLERRTVTLAQPGEPKKRIRTDVRGCYEFDRVVRGKSVKVKVAVPKKANR